MQTRNVRCRLLLPPQADLYGARFHGKGGGKTWLPGFELELTVNKDRIEPYLLGDGYGHLAVSVSDVAAEHERLLALGFDLGKIVDFNHDGAPLARFFFVSDPDGYKIEVLHRYSAEAPSRRP